VVVRINDDTSSQPVSNSRRRKYSRRSYYKSCNAVVHSSKNKVEPTNTCEAELGLGATVEVIDGVGLALLCEGVGLKLL